jgi:CRISPR-associated protein Csb3
MDSGDPQVLLSHMAFYGLAAILSNAGHADVRMSWTPGMRPRPQLSATDLTWQRIGEAVRVHAAQCAAPGQWLGQDVVLRGSARGLMSPRITTIPDQQWGEVQASRHAVLDHLTEQQRELDLRLIAALGEPSYWRRTSKGDRLQDDGASRLEMQARNQGSEIVSNKLRKLADTVGRWPIEHIIDGLTGTAVRDDINHNKHDSRTATGFTGPGPTDNAVAWCALWGISQFPLAHQITQTSVTTGHLGAAGSGWFYVPVWDGEWLSARLRTMLVSGALREVAGQGLHANANRSPVAEDTARRWLAARGVTAVVRFPVHRFGSDNAPERRAQRGQILPCG